MKFILKWRDAIHHYILQNGKPPKALIVNLLDLEEYEAHLSKLYPGGIIPIEGGVLRYKNVPIGFSAQLQRNEWAIEE